MCVLLKIFHMQILICTKVNTGVDEGRTREGKELRV